MILGFYTVVAGSDFEMWDGVYLGLGYREQDQPSQKVVLVLYIKKRVLNSFSISKRNLSQCLDTVKAIGL